MPRLSSKNGPETARRKIHKLNLKFMQVSTGSSHKKIDSQEQDMFENHTLSNI